MSAGVILSKSIVNICRYIPKIWFGRFYHSAVKTVTIGIFLRKEFSAEGILAACSFTGMFF